MSELHLTDEILMAFADGELDEPVAAAVAKVMAQDPAVTRRIVEFQQSRRLTRSFFASNLVPDVPSELRAVISAQIKAYEMASAVGKGPRPAEAKRRWPGRLSPMMMALAASIAAVAAVSGYFIGQHSKLDEGRLAYLEAPPVLRELSRLESGREVELPVGRLRVVSTYRLPNGSLCREFRLQTTSNSAGAVACRTDEWKVTFALAEAAKGAEYVPSSGVDLVDTYLGTLGAGSPLEVEAEAKSLAESGR